MNNTLWVSASVYISEVLGTASFWFFWKTCISDSSVFWGFGSDFAKHSKKPFLILLEQQSVLKHPKYRDIVTRYKLSLSHVAALGKCLCWGNEGVLKHWQVPKSKTIHWVSAGLVSKLCEMINLVGLTREAIIAPNCAQNIRDFPDDSWARRSSLH